jgi:SAM-dependent methyltransferase
MLERHDDIYASAPMCRLRQEQVRSLSADVQRCSGTHALLLTAAAGDVPPSSPLLGCWMTLHFNKGRYTGDLTAAASEPLPFIDDAFQLVMIQHVLEVASAPVAVLDDALRMLAPGGLLVITGLHPISAWSPWFWWRGRRTVQRLHFPLGLNGKLLGAGMDVERLARVGRSWPARPSTLGLPENIFGGGFVLVARKRRHTTTRLHLSRIGTPLSSRGPLSAETRRRAAQ